MSHSAAFVDLLEWKDMIKLTLFRIRVSLLKKVPETKLAFISQLGVYALA